MTNLLLFVSLVAGQGDRGIQSDATIQLAPLPASGSRVDTGIRPVLAQIPEAKPKGDISKAAKAVPKSKAAPKAIETEPEAAESEAKPAEKTEKKPASEPQAPDKGAAEKNGTAEKKDDAAKKESTKVPITSEIDVPYRSPSICIYDPWETTRWWFRERTMFLWRNETKDLPMVVDQAGNEVAGTQDFNFPGKVGLEATVGHHWDTAHGFEGSFLWVADATDQINLRSNGAISLPVFGPNSANFHNLTSFNSALKSRFWGTEVNYLNHFRDGTDHPYRFTGILGFRQIAFEESLGFESINIANAIGLYKGLSSNGIYAGQFGAKGTYRELLPGLNAEAWFKVGLGGNVVDTRQSLATGGINLPAVQGSSIRGTRFSQILDFGFEGVYKLTESVHLTLGYQLYFINKLGRATEQLQPDLNVTSPQPRVSGDLFLQGITLGFRCYWGHRADPNCRSGCCTPYIMLTDCNCQN